MIVLHRTGLAAIPQLLASRDAWGKFAAASPGLTETGAGAPKPALWPPLAGPRSWVGRGGGLPP